MNSNNNNNNIESDISTDIIKMSDINDAINLEKYIESIKWKIDERLKNRITYKNCSYYSNNIFNLFFILLNLKKKLKPNDHLIFLNGLPPIFKYKCDISIIFQNANLFREFYKINIIKWLFSKDSLRYLNFIIGKKNVKKQKNP